MTPTAGTVSDFAAAAIVLDTAGSPHDLFGPTPTDGNLTEATRRYRGLARLIHPDAPPTVPSRSDCSSGWASCGRSTPRSSAPAAL